MKTRMNPRFKLAQRLPELPQIRVPRSDRDGVALTPALGAGEQAQKSGCVVPGNPLLRLERGRDSGRPIAFACWPGRETLSEATPTLLLNSNTKLAAAR